MMKVLSIDETAVLTTPEVFVASDGFRLNYRKYSPAIQPGTKVPLVLFMHGAGERGGDNRAQLVHGVPGLVTYLRQTGTPAIVIAPQCPAEPTKWVEVDWGKTSHTMPSEPSRPMKAVLELLDKALASGKVDLDRVYVTGISMGGYATWDIIQRRASDFAAAMPLCGGGDTSLAPRLVNLPLWVFHGEKDGAVPVCRSRDMVAAIKSAGGTKVKYSETPGAGHDIWTAAYSDKEVWDWFFSNRR